MSSRQHPLSRAPKAPAGVRLVSFALDRSFDRGPSFAEAQPRGFQRLEAPRCGFELIAMLKLSFEASASAKQAATLAPPCQLRGSVARHHHSAVQRTKITYPG